MIKHFLTFEKNIADLEGKIEDLKHISSNSDLNIAEEKISNQNEDTNFLRSKIISSNFYNKHILSRSFGHFDIVLDGSKIISETLEEYI